VTVIEIALALRNEVTRHKRLSSQHRAAARDRMERLRAFCAANLLLRHPDVWHQSVSFVGYYDAAPRNRETHSGADVYGGDEALMDANSPRLLAPNVPGAMRADLFLVLLGNSSQAFYGPQLDGFTAVLDGARVADQQPGRPETIREVEPARFELGGQPAVEDDDLALGW